MRVVPLNVDLPVELPRDLGRQLFRDRVQQPRDSGPFASALLLIAGAA
jgi:hypothetical protein